MLTVGSLFSGIGGVEFGFEKAGGFRTIWFVENEPYAQAVLRKHWPSVPIYGDIRTIDFAKLEKPDILTGGFPCQDISNAGKRKGIGGERSGLWREFFRAIGEIRPQLVFVENVSALTYRGLLTVLGDLSEVGCDAEWHCLPASAVGAPHRRDRIYIIAYRNGNGCFWASDEKNRWAENRFDVIKKNICGNSNRCNENKVKGMEREKENSNSSRVCENVAYTNKPRLQRRWELRNGFETKELFRQGGKTFSDSDYYYYWEQRKKSLFEKNRRETWATDAGVLRVANGIPNRIQRIKCLGNAVVPQCAEFFAEIIKERLGVL